MRVSLFLAAALLIALAAGCQGPRSPVVPPFGTGFNDTGAPVNLQFRQTDLGAKKGEAKAQTILGLISTGDCSVATAARNGGITTIKHVDAEFMNVLGLVQEYTTIVYGD